MGADVAERVEEVALFGRHISWVRRRSACRRPFRPSVERLSDLFVPFDDVVELAGIGLQIVKLRARRADVPVSLVGKRRDRCPAEVIEAKHGFRIDRPWFQATITLEHGLERFDRASCRARAPSRN